MHLQKPDLPGMDRIVVGHDELDRKWLPGCAAGVDRASYREGWRGPWADKLIAKADKKRPIGQVTVTQWLNRLGHGPQWAVVLKLKVRPLAPSDVTDVEFE